MDLRLTYTLICIYSNVYIGREKSEASTHATNLNKLSA